MSAPQPKPKPKPPHKHTRRQHLKHLLLLTTTAAATTTTHPQTNPPTTTPTQTQTNPQPTTTTNQTTNPPTKPPPQPTQPPTPKTNADIGTIWPHIQKITTHNHHPLAYTHPQFQSLNQWKKITRAKLLQLLHYTPPRAPLQPQTTQTTDQGDHTQKHIQFNTTPHTRTPAILLTPKNAQTRATPAIIALHDHSGFYLWGKEKINQTPNENPTLHQFKQHYYDGNNWATDLAKQGYIVITTDLPYWGERRMILDNDPHDWRTRPPDIPPHRITAYNTRSAQYEPLINRTIQAAGTTWPGINLWDDHRTIDYLLTQPQVNPRRIAAIGFSLGAIRACLLGALDNRIKTTIAAGWMTSIPHQLKNHTKHTIGPTMLIPGIHRYLDYPDIAALNAPKPLLIINGNQDPLFPPQATTHAYQQLKKSYQKAQHPQQLTIREFNAPHIYNTPMQTTTQQFLKQTL